MAREEKGVTARPSSSSSSSAPSTSLAPISPALVLVPSTAHANPVLGFQIASLECLFVFMEVIFGEVVTREMGMGMARSLLGGQVPDALAVAIRIAASFLIVVWVLHRIGSGLRLGLKRFVQLLLRPNPSATPAGGVLSYFTSSQFLRVTLVVIVAHVASMLLMIYLQHSTGNWIYSTANYYDASTGRFDGAAAFDMLISSPIREELVFRGVMLTNFYKRMGGRSAYHKTRCAAAAGVIFGAVHLLNLFNDKFTVEYIALQVTLGFLIGFFYAMRMFSAGLIDTCVLHISNNIAASFVPKDFRMDWSDPLRLFALVQTVVMYVALIFFIARHMRTHRGDARGMYAPIDEMFGAQEDGEDEEEDEAGEGEGDKDGQGEAEEKKSKNNSKKNK